MANEVGLRIKQIVEDLGVYVIYFCDKVGASPQTYNNWWQGKSKPNIEVIIRIIEEYPQYNTEWLLLGKGKMKGDDKEGKHRNDTEEITKKIEKFKELIGKLNKDMEAL